jgi:hypothetical protein
MGSTVYVTKPKAESLRLYNTTGVALVLDEFVAMGGKSLKAKEAIADAVLGGFENLLGQVVQAADYTGGAATFATGNLPVYWNPTTKVFSNTATVGNYRVGYTVGPKVGDVIEFVAIDAMLIASTVEDLAAADIVLAADIAAIKALGGIPFRRTAVLTSALATTPVDILTTAEVGTGRKAYITDIDASVGGTAVWAGTGTVVLLRDKAGSPVTAVSFAKAQLTSQAQLGKHSAGVTLATPVRTGVGMTTYKGLEVVADGTFETTGSDLSVTVCGFIA